MHSEADSVFDPVPVGRLNSVKTDWDFQPGWVRAPLKEVVFNERLSKQARLLWLWLASVKDSKKALSWGECESMLSCGTKARRNCLSQLLVEGFIEFTSEGVVTLNNPYEVYTNTKRRINCDVRHDCVYNLKENIEIISPEEVKPIIAIQRNQKHSEESDKARVEKIIKSWNESKPKGYSSLRSLSKKQLECITKHCRNLAIKRINETDLIINVCKGLQKSNFWSNEVSSSAKNFNAVFGYGSPQDTKMKNIETLFQNGMADTTQSEPVPSALSPAQQELVDAYKFVKLNLETAKSRSNADEIDKYKLLLENVKDELIINNISLDDL